MGLIRIVFRKVTVGIHRRVQDADNMNRLVLDPIEGDVLADAQRMVEAAQVRPDRACIWMLAEQVQTVEYLIGVAVRLCRAPLTFRVLGDFVQVLPGRGVDADLSYFCGA